MPKIVSVALEFCVFLAEPLSLLLAPPRKAQFLFKFCNLTVFSENGGGHLFIHSRIWFNGFRTIILVTLLLSYRSLFIFLLLAVIPQVRSMVRAIALLFTVTITPRTVTSCTFFCNSPHHTIQVVKEITKVLAVSL